MNKIKLGEVVRELRGTLSYKSFGEKIGVSWMAVSKWEKGMSMPDFDNLSKLATMYGLPIEDFTRMLDCKILKPSDADDVMARMKLLPKSELPRVIKLGVELLSLK